MKTIRPNISHCAIALSLSSPAFAGETYIDQPEANPIVSKEADAFTDWATPTIDARLRYEFRDQGSLDASNGVTARARVGLLTRDFGGFSAFGEVEATTAIARDFQSNPLGLDVTTPFVPGNTVTSDPENAELNRFWLQYKKDGVFAKVGRQRILRNNVAFIGNVGWRQNEQTFDAAQIGYAKDAFSATYVYSNRVQRIFGETEPVEDLPLEEFEGQYHLFDLTYESSLGKLGAYAYLIDLDSRSALPGAAQTALGNVGESNTFGAYANLGPVYAEFAYQNGDSNFEDDYDAYYGHLKYTKKFGKASVTAGIEYLSDNFKTPFATVHAFNGFADAFVLDRIGLRNGPGGDFDGISDVYLSYVQPGLPGGITLKAFAHYFADDSFDDTYGYEFDLVLVKKFSENFTGLIKGAYFSADNDASFSDIRQVTVDLSYTF